MFLLSKKSFYLFIHLESRYDKKILINFFFTISCLNHKWDFTYASVQIESHNFSLKHKLQCHVVLRWCDEGMHKFVWKHLCNRNPENTNNLTGLCNRLGFFPLWIKENGNQNRLHRCNIFFLFSVFSCTKRWWEWSCAEMGGFMTRSLV